MYMCPFPNISPYYYISNNTPNIHFKTLSVSIGINEIYFQFYFFHIYIEKQRLLLLTYDRTWKI